MTAIQSVRLDPEVLLLVRRIGKLSKESTSGTVREIVTLWMLEYADEDGALDLDAAADAVRAGAEARSLGETEDEDS